jgi:hypothetical protein
LSVLGLAALLAAALVAMAVLSPTTQQATTWPDVTPIPLPGAEGVLYSPLPEQPNAIYIASDPLQSPLETPMP